MEQVESVVSLLDVPLIESPPVSLAELSEEVPTLASPRTDRSRARQEFLSSPMYRDLIISPDGRTAAMQVNFRRDETWHRLLKQRNELREKSLQGELTADEQASLDAIRRDAARLTEVLPREAPNDSAAEGEAEGPFGKADVRPRIPAVRGIPGVAGTSLIYSF